MNVCEEVVVANEGEDAWSTELEEIGEGFARLAVENEAGEQDDKLVQREIASDAM